MMKFILGKKLEMTTFFSGNGKAVPATIISAGPCVILNVKTVDGADKYNAVQLGFGKRKKINKPLGGILKKFNQNFQTIREFKFSDRQAINDYNKGDTMTVEIFNDVKKVNISGLSKGRGFQGGVKRHGFSGGRASHGDRHVLRQIGSVGASFPEKVWKGKRMPGHMGPRRFTVKNLEVLTVVPEENLLIIKGAVPGHKNSVLEIREVKLD